MLHTRMSHDTSHSAYMSGPCRMDQHRTCERVMSNVADTKGSCHTQSKSRVTYMTESRHSRVNESRRTHDWAMSCRLCFGWGRTSM